MQPRQIYYFLIPATILLFAFLGSREIWTQEWRWGEIVRWMMLHKDYFRPMLAGQLYFDKPLLSYWIMIGTAKLMGLSTWAIRLPSAIAGFISIIGTYQIGKKWINKKTGWFAAMMLTTTYYFVFWARTASTDMLNLAGIVLATAWYFTKRKEFTVFNSSIFFIILAFTALLKGLIGIIAVLLILAPDLLPRLKQNFKWSLLLAPLPAIVLYFLPFWFISTMNHTSITESGLYDVYRENILRFFEPFDHKEPLYTYFIYLPIYLLPWTFFFFAAFFQLPKRWKVITPPTKQLFFSNLLLLTFLTLSGSRRSYYILAQVPFAILFTAEWLTHHTKIARNTFIFSFIGLLSWFILFQPWYYSGGGLPLFAQQLSQFIQKNPKQYRTIAFLNADNRLSFYLPNDEIVFLKENSSFKQYHLLITRADNVKSLKKLGFKPVLLSTPHLGNQLLGGSVEDAPVCLARKAG